MTRMPLYLRNCVIGFNNLMKPYGAVHSPNGKQLNSYMIPWKEKRRYLLWDLCIGTRKYESFESKVAKEQSLVTRRLTVLISSILKCGGIMN